MSRLSTQPVQIRKLVLFPIASLIFQLACAPAAAQYLQWSQDSQRFFAGPVQVFSTTENESIFDDWNQIQEQLIERNESVSRFIPVRPNPNYSEYVALMIHSDPEYSMQVWRVRDQETLKGIEEPIEADQSYYLRQYLSPDGSILLVCSSSKAYIYDLIHDRWLALEDVVIPFRTNSFGVTPSFPDQIGFLAFRSQVNQLQTSLQPVLVDWMGSVTPIDVPNKDDRGKFLSLFQADYNDTSPVPILENLSTRNQQVLENQEERWIYRFEENSYQKQFTAHLDTPPLSSEVPQTLQRETLYGENYEVVTQFSTMPDLRGTELIVRNLQSDCQQVIDCDDKPWKWSFSLWPSPDKKWVAIVCRSQGPYPLVSKFGLICDQHGRIIHAFDESSQMSSDELIANWQGQTRYRLERYNDYHNHLISLLSRDDLRRGCTDPISSYYDLTTFSDKMLKDLLCLPESPLKADNVKVILSSQDTLTRQGVQSLSRCPDITGFHVTDFEPSVWDLIATHKNVESISGPLDDQSLRILAGLKNVRHLHFRGTEGLTAEGIASAENYQHLATVTFGSDPCLPKPEVLPISVSLAQLQSLGGNPELKALNISGSITGTGVAPVQSFRSLESILIGGSASAETFNLLGKMPALKTLAVNGKVTVDEIKGLRNSASLVSLTLNIGDQMQREHIEVDRERVHSALDSLTAIPSLETIHLTGLTVQSEHFNKLKRWTKARKIDLHDVRCSRESILKFAAGFRKPRIYMKGKYPSLNAETGKNEWIPFEILFRKVYPD